MATRRNTEIVSLNEENISLFQLREKGKPEIQVQTSLKVSLGETKLLPKILV